MKRVLVVGGGSAGVGAAWRAALCGAEVTLVEAGSILGGTSTLGGVNCWEPGIASAHLNKLLYERMSMIPLSCGAGRAIHTYTPETCMGLHGIIEGLPYEQTLRRNPPSKLLAARVHFEPLAMHRAMWDLLAEAGVRIWTNASVIGVDAQGERLVSAHVRDNITDEEADVSFDVMIDCTADAVVSRMAGVKVHFGEDARSEFDEASAPEKPSKRVNGVSLIFRTTPDETVPIQEAPAWAKSDEAAQAWLKDHFPASHVVIYPNGDRNYNPLPIMEGEEYFSLPSGERYMQCMARVYLYWDRMKQEKKGHEHMRLSWVAPRIGVRESWRVAAMNTLTEHQVRGGVIDDNSIALGDHALDTHGSGSKACGELNRPFGIPLGSIIVSEYDNMLVAGRCAGFSHIAASSCRLSRTMMDLGEAAGAVAALTEKDARTAKAGRIREALAFERYLDWMETVYPTIGMEGEC